MTVIVCICMPVLPKGDEVSELIKREIVVLECFGLKVPPKDHSVGMPSYPARPIPNFSMLCIESGRAYNVRVGVM